MAVADKELAFFTFEELCNRPLAATDYIALRNTYHTICVANVPVIDVVSGRNASRRLTKFIDEAYRVGTNVVVSAASPIENPLCVRRNRRHKLRRFNRTGFSHGCSRCRQTSTWSGSGGRTTEMFRTSGKMQMRQVRVKTRFFREGIIAGYSN